MKKFLISLLFFVSSFCFGASGTFTADDTTTYDLNPERGFYIPLQPGEACNGTAAAYIVNTNMYGQAFSLFFYHWDPSSGTTQLAADLTCIRSLGVKLIILPVYCSVQFCDEGFTPSQVLSHISAAASTFSTYRDVIYSIQMGLIGAWGEDADSGRNLDNTTNRPAIEAALLAAVPKEISIHQHAPGVVAQRYPTPLTRATAFRGSDLARMGVANYSFLATSNDNHNFPGAVTISNGATGINTGYVLTTTELQQRNWAAAQTEFVPFITETVLGSPNPRTGCTAGNDGAGLSGGILNEGVRYHLSAMNRSYEVAFMNAWTSGGCYAYVNNHIGYRLQLDSYLHPDTATHGTTVQFFFNVTNRGWARFMFERHLVVTLTKTGATPIVCVGGNDLRLLPSNAAASLKFQIDCDIPGGATLGVYAVNVSAPDNHSIIAAVRAYMVRFANANSGGQVWDNTNGRMPTGSTITIN